jgi:hypothetical protein
MIESLFAGIACSNFILDVDGETLIFVHDKSSTKSYQLVLRNFQSYPIDTIGNIFSISLFLFCQEFLV